MKRLLLLCACLLWSRVAFAGSPLVANVVTDHAASGDAKRAGGITTSITTGNLTSTVDLWVVGDVGKVAWCINTGVGETQPNIVVTTISAYTNARAITLGANSNGTTSSAECVWGTADDTAEITAAVTAVSATTGTTSQGNYLGQPGTVYMPPGGYIVGSRIYNKQDGAVPGPNFIGAGPQKTIIYPRPDMTLPGDGSGVLIHASGSGMTFGGFTVHGQKMRYSTGWVDDADLIRFIGLSRFVVEDIEVLEIGQSTSSNSAILKFQDSSHGIVRGVTIQNGPPLDKFISCEFQGSLAITVIQTFCSNHERNLLVSNSLGRTPTSMQLNWIGGGADECGTTTQSCTMLVGGTMNAVGATFWQPANATTGAIDVDATSRLWLNDCDVGAYNSAEPHVGMKIQSGGIAYAASSTFRGNAGSKAINNLGTLIDGGLNNYQNCTGSTCTTKTAGQAVSGKQPIKR